MEGNDLAVAVQTHDLLDAMIARAGRIVYEARHNLSAIPARGVFAIVVEHCDCRSARHATNSLSRTAAFVLANLISHDSTTLAAGCERKEFTWHILILIDQIMLGCRESTADRVDALQRMQNSFQEEIGRYSG